VPFTTDAGSAIYYETTGDPKNPPIVLISGAGAQLIWWRDEFVRKLLDRGLFVIRLDNRDVGKSARIGGPNDVDLAYHVRDMADDVCRVLDALDISDAHIVGQSLGGIISQLMAITRPERVRSMVVFYTVPAFAFEYLTEEILQAVVNQPAQVGEPALLTREQTIEEFVGRERATSSTGYAFDEVWMRQYVTACVDRGYCPGGVQRQAKAAMSIGDLRPDLEKLTLPAAVIHGKDDRLLKVDGGYDIGRLVQTAELHIYPGMGHEFPQPLWDEFVNIIVRTTQRAA
jgi:pimeloyl-ACP methyl ester carboxylesterase